MNRKVQSGVSMGTLIAAADGPARGGNDRVQVASAEENTDANYQEASFEAPKLKKKVRGSAQIIQVGAFRSLDGAEQARAALSTIGPVQVYEWDSANGPLYKVQMGPFLSSIGADDALTAVRAEGYNKALLENARIEQVAHTY
jgi:cell division protein FtsN